MDEQNHILSHSTTTSRTRTCVLLGRKHSRHSVAWPGGVLVCCLLLAGCEARGRLVDPPSRASMWRYEFSNPVDFSDDRVNCGGFVRQWRKNQGRCGVCGDPWDLPEPRPHETRGIYGRGIIVRNYTQAQAVVVEVEVTASGRGHFEYQLCSRTSAWIQETPDCFTHPLKDDFGRSQIPVNVTQKFARVRHVLRLPQEVVCPACILQWKFVTADRAGRAEYRACADIAITSASTSQADNVTTPITTTTTDTTITATTATTDADTVTAINTEETTTPLSLTFTNPPSEITFLSSHAPEANLVYPHATHKPTPGAEAPQVDAASATPRMDDGSLNVDIQQRGTGNSGTLSCPCPLSFYYGLTLLTALRGSLA